MLVFLSTSVVLNFFTLSLQVHERGTVYCQPSAQPPNRSLPSNKNLKCFFLDSHFGRDNVNIDYVKCSSKSLYHIMELSKLS